MDIQIIKGPGNAAAKVVLGAQEQCIAEGGAMLAMRGGFEIETATHSKKRSIMGGLKRLVGGESFFLNHFRADSNGGEILFSSTLPGDMVTLDLTGVGIVAEAGSFVVRSSTVEMDTGWQGLKSAFAGEGLFWLRLHGRGPVVLNSFGAIYAVDIDGDYIVDTGHIVAFEETLNFKISKAGKSWLSSILGGEGLVCKFTGKGRIWCQSHHAPAFGRILGPMLRPR